MSNVNIIVEEEENQVERKVGICNDGAILVDETNSSRVVVESDSDGSSICSSVPEDDSATCSATNKALSGILDSRVLDVKALPPASEINVRDSNDVHFGHKIYTAPVTVVQAIDDIKDKYRDLFKLLPQRKADYIRCSTIICLGWSVVTVIGLAVFLTIRLTSQEGQLIDIGLNETWFIRRTYWHALDPISRNFLKLPIDAVLIGHTVTSYCKTDAECKREVNQIQADHIRRIFSDIGYNYLVGKNGILFEGRGSNVVGSHTYKWNSKSIMIAFLGNYNHNKTDQLQWDHIIILLDHIERQGVLSPDYKIYGACQVAGSDSPGRYVVAGLKNLKRWYNGSMEDCRNHIN